jgi:thiol-disulfide isomerase/thioredoxin
MHIKSLMFFLLLSTTAYSQADPPFDISIIQNSVGKKFIFPDCTSTKGVHYNSKSNIGKLTLINFWFENCEPCVAEIGAMNKLYKKYKNNKDIAIISFTFESPRDAVSFAKKHAIEYPIVCVSNRKCHELNFQNGFPTTLITNSLGKVAFITSGGSIDPKEADKEFDKTLIPKIEELLKNKKTAKE